METFGGLAMVSGKKDTSRQRLSPRDKQVLLERMAQLQLESLEQNIILDMQLLALAP